MAFLQEFIINALLTLYSISGNLGVAIIIFTLLVKTILIPISLPSLKAAKKMKEIQPEIKKLQKKHKDKKALQLAQVELYKKYNINPLAGCIPQIVQLGLLIILYQAMITFLSQPEINGVVVRPEFLWLNLAKPDQLFIIPVLAGLSQLVLSVMLAPAAEKRDIVPNSSKVKKIKEENKKEEDMADMAQKMQQQMLYLMPVMTGFIAINFPSGLGLYWIITTVFSIGQQWSVSGPGGLMIYSQRLKTFILSKTAA